MKGIIMFNIPKQFRVNVDNKCIEIGKSKDSAGYAVSMAVGKYFGDKLGVSTKPDEYCNDGGWIVEFFVDDEKGVEHAFRFITSPDIEMWLKSFDDGLDVKPIQLDFQYDIQSGAQIDGSHGYINYDGEVKSVMVSETQKEMIEKIQEIIGHEWYYGRIQQQLDMNKDTLVHLMIGEDGNSFYAWGEKYIYFLVKVMIVDDDHQWHLECLPLSPEFVDTTMYSYRLDW